MFLELTRFNYKLLFPDPQYDYRKIQYGYKDLSVPGTRKFFSILLNGKFEGAGEIINMFLVDTRDNTLVVKRHIYPVPSSGNIYYQLNKSEYSDIDRWVVNKFQEYKESNFKFGNDMYEPTEQITVEGFFSYLKSCNRDEVLEEAIQ